MESTIRLTIALGIFMVMITWEALSPRRALTLGRKQRWPVNLGLAVLNMIVMRLTIGSLALLSAVNAADHGWGVLNLFELPLWVKISTSLLILDFAVYYQHRLMHRWPLLWRLHQVHHADLEFDASTAVRFHPLEIVLSMLYKVAWIYLIGADTTAVIAFEIILNGAATFNHGNVNLPLKLDAILRKVIITPDLHRIHHSMRQEETDSNFGFSISIWDRLCHTLIEEPRQSQSTMAIGLTGHRLQNRLGFLRMLRLPFEAQRQRGSS